MSTSVREGIQDAEADLEFLKELSRAYPEAVFEPTIPGWVSERLTISDCDDLDFEGEMVYPFKRLGQGRVYIPVTRGGRIPVNVFLMKLREDNDLLLKLLGVLKGA